MKSRPIEAIGCSKKGAGEWQRRVFAAEVQLNVSELKAPVFCRYNTLSPAAAMPAQDFFRTLCKCGVFAPKSSGE